MMRKANAQEMALAAIDALYREVDRMAKTLNDIHGQRLRCSKGCIDCCTDGITVFSVEAGHIARAFPNLLQNERPHPEGACAMLDADGACRIYEARPYVCRTHGYPLRWIEEVYDGEPVEMRDICPLNQQAPPIEELPGEACWTIGPVEERLQYLESVFQAREPKRIALRGLFQKT